MNGVLPKRPGAQLPLSAFDRANDEIEFRIDPVQEAALDAAFQALLHWAGATHDPLTLSELLGTVDDWRGDFAKYNGEPRVTYEDWKQNALNLYSQIRSLPKPDSARLRHMFGSFGALITTSHDLRWWGDPTRAEWLAGLRMDVADWILGADAPLDQKASHIAHTVLGWPYRGPRDVAGPVILKRLLSEYATSITDQIAHSPSSQFERARLDAQMGMAAAYADRPEMALCFRGRSNAVLASATAGLTPEQTKSLQEANGALTSALQMTFGSE